MYVYCVSSVRVVNGSSRSSFGSLLFAHEVVGENEMVE